MVARFVYGLLFAVAMTAAAVAATSPASPTPASAPPATAAPPAASSPPSFPPASTTPPAAASPAEPPPAATSPASPTPASATPVAPPATNISEVKHSPLLSFPLLCKTSCPVCPIRHLIIPLSCPPCPECQPCPPCPECPEATPSPAPSPAPSPDLSPTPPPAFAKYGYLFSAFGVALRLLPWIVFQRMTPEDWAREQLDCYSEWLLLVEIGGSFTLMVLHCYYVKKRNLDTVLGEIIAMAMCFAQIRHVLQEKARACDIYAASVRRKYALLFMMFILVLFGVMTTLAMYYIQEELDDDPKHGSKFSGTLLAVAVCAAVFKTASIAAPPLSRMFYKKWDEDAKAAEVVKKIDAFCQLIPTAFDVWNYCYVGSYFKKPFHHGNCYAAALAITCLLHSVLLIIGRMLGVKRTKVMMDYIAAKVWRMPHLSLLPTSHSAPSTMYPTADVHRLLAAVEETRLVAVMHADLMSYVLESWLAERQQPLPGGQ